MSKIATMTFHWPANYGAVLQAFALQKFLQVHGADTQIIDYIPRRVELLKTLCAFKRRDFRFFKKRRMLRRFCTQELCLSSKTYRDNRSLHRLANEYDTIICGSDQIWNEFFTGGAEGKPTFSYYLNFAGERTKRVSYAASFGTRSLKPEIKECITPHLKKFDRLSVRENSGREILKELGFDAVVTVDPTLLHSHEVYEKLLEGYQFPQAKKVFTYILHESQHTAQKVCHLVQRRFGQKEEDGSELYIDLRQWLHDLSKAEFVVTNSFHGAVFAVLFHKPFLVLPVENSGMNDRIETLMQALGLSERIVSDEKTAQERLTQGIDWEDVDARLKVLRKTSETYLNEVIEE